MEAYFTDDTIEFRFQVLFFFPPLTIIERAENFVSRQLEGDFLFPSEVIGPVQLPVTVLPPPRGFRR